MKLTWNKLLCSETLAEKEKAPSSWVDYPLDPFEQDYREIISSVSFRHIQDKAQVYQLKRGNYVRTRLTHSLEVSTIAKQLGIMLVYNEKWNRIPVFKDLPVDQARAIPTVLACAGLLHDMGNPPFGHEGEYAIGFWFRKRLEDRDFTYHGTPVRDLLTERMKRELCSFDGNAQVIRTLAKCRFPSEEQEANVSYATISALLKYPVSSMECDPVSEDPRVRKSGFFLSEEALVRRVREKTGMDLPGEPYARNPLTVILEASDDIAYVTSDIEDAVSKHSIGISQLVSFMEKEVEALPEGETETERMQVLTVQGMLRNLTNRLETCDRGDHRGREEQLHKWTNYMRNWLMYVCAGSFVANWEAIMDGTYRGELLKSSYHRYTIEILKKAMRLYVYPAISDIHITAYTILDDLMSKFCNAVVEWDGENTADNIKKAYVEQIPERVKAAYLKERTGDEIFDLYLRFRMVSDYIADMTDGYALDLYQKLNGYTL